MLKEHNIERYLDKQRKLIHPNIERRTPGTASNSGVCVFRNSVRVCVCDACDACACRYRAHNSHARTAMLDARLISLFHCLCK